MKSDSGRQECELCDSQPGSSPCMVIVRPTPASLAMRGQLPLKKIYFCNIFCVRGNNIHSVWSIQTKQPQREGGRKARERDRQTDRQDRQREIRRNQQTCFGLPATHTPAQTTCPLTHRRHLPGLHQNDGRPSAELEQETSFPSCYLQQLEPRYHVMCFIELLNWREVSTGAIPASGKRGWLCPPRP
ncbi:hypothetical protein HJG60_011718 [Phyllostomus discolor]|uniref:Uncharacterized protein n=1 Tax=Phyllostomus discolor TaxID=89673 RepID=A0A833ZN85_9CHIR|nr:hypothetical protein HJG60_011718 [Phyllostomus discolor]